MQMLDRYSQNKIGQIIILLVFGYFEHNVDIILSFSFSPTGEIAFLEGLTIVYKSSIDLFFYVVGSSHENEVICLFKIIFKP